MRLTTYTGTEFMPATPAAADVHPMDIIHPLSMQCRYGGHVKRFYSVAEHCVHVSHLVEPENALWALLHDASEAYIVDIPAPVKALLPEYLGIEAGIMAAVCERFGLAPEMPQEVREADIRIRSDEGLLLIHGEHPWIIPQDAFGIEIRCLTPARASLAFIRRLRELWAGWSDDFLLLP